jgi:hypothetical protein
MHAQHTSIYQRLQIHIKLSRSVKCHHSASKLLAWQTRGGHHRGPSHRQREVVEHLCAVPPGIGIAILSLTFVIEAIHLCGRKSHDIQFARAMGFATTYSITT